MGGDLADELWSHWNAARYRLSGARSRLTQIKERLTGEANTYDPNFKPANIEQALRHQSPKFLEALLESKNAPVSAEDIDRALEKPNSLFIKALMKKRTRHRIGKAFH